METEREWRKDSVEGVQKWKDETKKAEKATLTTILWRGRWMKMKMINVLTNIYSSKDVFRHALSPSGIFPLTGCTCLFDSASCRWQQRYIVDVNKVSYSNRRLIWWHIVQELIINDSLDLLIYWYHCSSIVADRCHWTCFEIVRHRRESALSRQSFFLFESIFPHLGRNRKQYRTDQPSGSLSLLSFSLVFSDFFSLIWEKVWSRLALSACTREEIEMWNKE